MTQEGGTITPLNPPCQGDRDVGRRTSPRYKGCGFCHEIAVTLSEAKRILRTNWELINCLFGTEISQSSFSDRTPSK